jgi:hypothetical protein
MNTEYDNFIKENGIPLEDKLGVKERAFRKNNALKLLDIMRDSNMGCSGGDVIIKKNDKYSYANANWYYDCGENETQEHYVANSILNAKAYINDFPEEETEKYYFVIVP